MQRTRTALLITIVAIVAACAAPGAATNPPATSGPTAAAAGLTLEVRTDAKLGAYVAGKDGKSLYVFTKDSAGTSACAGDCAGTWPPLTVAAAADVKAGTGVTGTLGTITRADGAIQVTLGGAPLYYYAPDSAAGDVKGQGIGGFWFLASPAGTTVGGGAAGTPAAGTPGPTECADCY